MKTTKKTRRAARELFRLCFVDGVLNDERARQVVARVLASPHRARLPVLAAFERLIAVEQERHTALVESAVPLGGTLRNEIQAGLAKAYGPRLVTFFQENAALIGGVRVKVGSDVYDGSIRARLAALERKL